MNIGNDLHNHALTNGFIKYSLLFNVSSILITTAILISSYFLINNYSVIAISIASVIIINMNYLAMTNAKMYFIYLIGNEENFCPEKVEKFDNYQVKITIIIRFLVAALAILFSILVGV
jgi:cellulose synthase/poly-beta-1,6-N-acetylglucosamine synthase-like glycosyltransferase